MTSQERLTILRGIEKKIDSDATSLHYGDRIAEALQLLNFLIMDDLKTVQAQDEAKMRKDGAN